MTDDLHSIVSRLEALDEELAGINADRASVFQDAKLVKLDIPALRIVLAERRRRAKNPAAYEALQGTAADYRDALDNGIVLEHARAPAPAKPVKSTERTAAHKPGAVPEGRLAGEEPAVPDPIPEPPAGVPPFTTDCDPVAASTLPAVPAGAPYRPSNGTEGEIFMGQWCANCKRDAARRADPEAGDGCLIPVYAMALKIGDPSYPREWVRGSDGHGRCTAFKPDDGDDGIDAGWEKADSAATFFVGHAVAGGKEPHPSVPDTAKTVAVIASLADDPGPPPDFLRAGSAARAAITGRR